MRSFNGELPNPRSPVFSQVRILKALRARITELSILKDVAEGNAEECGGPRYLLIGPNNVTLRSLRRLILQGG
jgi:hypothetical protein